MLRTALSLFVIGLFIDGAYNFAQAEEKIGDKTIEKTVEKASEKTVEKASEKTDVAKEKKLEIKDDAVCNEKESDDDEKLRFNHICSFKKLLAKRNIGLMLGINYRRPTADNGFFEDQLSYEGGVWLNFSPIIADFGMGIGNAFRTNGTLNMDVHTRMYLSPLFKGEYTCRSSYLSVGYIYKGIRKFPYYGIGIGGDGLYAEINFRDSYNSPYIVMFGFGIRGHW